MDRNLTLMHNIRPQKKKVEFSDSAGLMDWKKLRILIDWLNVFRKLFWSLLSYSRQIEISKYFYVFLFITKCVSATRCAYISVSRMTCRVHRIIYWRWLLPFPMRWAKTYSRALRKMYASLFPIYVWVVNYDKQEKSIWLTFIFVFVVVCFALTSDSLVLCGKWY